MNIAMSFLVDSAAAITVLHEVSRLLLTVGVGLFLGYLVLLIGANLFGLVPRYASKASHGKHAAQHPLLPEPSPNQRTETLITSGSDRKETRA